LPEIFAVHESVDDPDPPLIDDEESVQTKLVEFVVTPRATVEVNPLRGATLIVEVPVTPTATVKLVGFADTEKSAAAVTWKVTAAVCERLLLVPVTVAR